MLEEKIATPVDKKMSTEKLYKLLSAPIPEQYLFKYEEDGVKLTGYNAQYAINLLNEVIGLGKWYTIQNIRKEDFLRKGYYVVTDLQLEIPEYKIRIYSHSASYAKKIENAYKGAKTSAFKAACKYLGIGNELYIQNTVDEDVIYVKEETQEPKIEISAEAVELEKKINEAKTVEQLESLTTKVNSIEGISVKKVLLKKYNQKKIQLTK